MRVLALRSKRLVAPCQDHRHDEGSSRGLSLCHCCKEKRAKPGDEVARIMQMTSLKGTEIPSGSLLSIRFLEFSGSKFSEMPRLIRFAKNRVSIQRFPVETAIYLYRSKSGLQKLRDEMTTMPPLDEFKKVS